jgi:hypothetical protein
VWEGEEDANRGEAIRKEQGKKGDREGLSEQDCKWSTQLPVPRFYQGVPYFQNVLRFCGTLL